MSAFRTAIQEMDIAAQTARELGLTAIIYYQPFNCFQRQFNEGVLFEIGKGKRRTDIFCAGGRYDAMIGELQPGTAAENNEPVRAVGLQISLDRISHALAAFQANAVKTWVKEQRSFGYWSPRRCDVYVISHQPDCLHDRLEIVALLWNHGISADFMYEHGVQEGAEAIHQICLKEGILFVLSAPFALFS
jgi:translation initiation factor 2-alpha kinase 4